MSTISIAEALPLEQARCREMLEHVLELPAESGKYLAAMLNFSLKQAEVASASGDPILMIRAYQELKGYQE